MRPTIILPYNAKRTTPLDLLRIEAGLGAKNPDIRLIAYEESCTPVALAGPFSARTLTCTLDNHTFPPIFEHIPGPKFFPTPRTKLQLFTEVQDAGHRVPYTEVFTPTRTPDLARFGPLMTVKTMVPWTARATGIFTLRTEQFHELKDSLAQIYASEIARGFPPLLQEYIPTGPKPTHTRVTTFLHAPIVCFSSTAPEVFDTKSLSGLAGGEATSNASSKRTRALCNDEEIIAFAVEISRSFPDAAVLSVDIVRCPDTQKLYCLEVNLGNLCVLSAPICRRLLNDLGPVAVHGQFGSYKTITTRMVETLEAL